MTETYVDIFSNNPSAIRDIYRILNLSRNYDCNEFKKKFPNDKYENVNSLFEKNKAFEYVRGWISVTHFIHMISIANKGFYPKKQNDIEKFFDEFKYTLELYCSIALSFENLINKKLSVTYESEHIYSFLEDYKTNIRLGNGKEFYDENFEIIGELYISILMKLGKFSYFVNYWCLEDTLNSLPQLNLNDSLLQKKAKQIFTEKKAYGWFYYFPHLFRYVFFPNNIFIFNQLDNNSFISNEVYDNCKKNIKKIMNDYLTNYDYQSYFFYGSKNSINIKYNSIYYFIDSLRNCPWKIFFLESKNFFERIIILDLCNKALFKLLL
jgi:hypothetical protein